MVTANNLIISTTTTTTMSKKKTQGRKKIEIKKIEEVNNRQVTFSKRRVGMFKKASELCVLTGSEIAIIVLSPGGRVFAFGHPSTDSLVERYLSGSNGEDLGSTRKNLPPLQEFNRHYLQVSKELEVEKKMREKIQEEKMVSSCGSELWWEAAIDRFGPEELEQYVASLEEFKKKVLVRADELMMIRSSSMSNMTIFGLGLEGFGNNYFQNNMALALGTALPNAVVPAGFSFGHGTDIK